MMSSERKSEPHIGFLVVGIVLAVLCCLAISSLALADTALTIVANKKGNSKSLEAKSIAVSSDGKFINFVFDAGQDVKAYLLRNQAHSIAAVYLDTDLNDKTGGKPFFSKFSGFEYSIYAVYVCKAFKQGGASGRVCAGDMPNATFTEFYSDYTPKLWDPAKKNFQRVHDVFWKGGKNVVKGSKVFTKVPYREFNGRSGQTVRMMILAGRSNGSKFPQVTLTLK